MIVLCLLGLFITKTTYRFPQEEKVQEIKRNTSTDEILKTPAEHHGDADVNEFAFGLELPLTLRFKIDIEPKALHVNTVEDTDNVGFGDTRLALRAMLVENDIVSLSTGSVVNIPTGDEGRELGEEVTTLGQQLAFWIDLGDRISLHTFLGVDVPTGGNHKEDADMDFLYGSAVSKTFTIHESPVLHGITPFVALITDNRLIDFHPAFNHTYSKLHISFLFKMMYYYPR